MIVCIVLSLTVVKDGDIDHIEIQSSRFARSVKLCSTRMPRNCFAEIKQAAFSPSHTVLGLEPPLDPVLSRLFSNPDKHRHHLGTNKQQTPVNALLVPIANFQRDGFMCVDGHQGSRPNDQSSIGTLQYTTLMSAVLAHEHNLTAGVHNFLS